MPTEPKEEAAKRNQEGAGQGAQQVYNGVDTFVIRNGRIVKQSIHYQLDGGSGEQG